MAEEELTDYPAYGKGETGSGILNLGRFGRWAFAEFKEVYAIEAEFAKLIEKINTVQTD